ncbi:MAG TPA: hypothetical protein DCE44_18920, partial [Verrucomicrobiales bacterium]|nr:hypothetical protein [Verrucomicrobiales bacterium]
DTGVIPVDQFLAGWDLTGSVGVANATQTAADNGTIPEQDHVGFLQGEGSAISQLIIGVVPNTEYSLTFAYNAPTGSAPRLQVKVGEAVVSEENVTPVGGANPYATKTVKFTPTEVTARITFTQVAAGDQTVVLDDIRLVGLTAPPLTPLEFSPIVGELSPGQTLAVTLTIPPEANATGPFEVQLRSANSGVATLPAANEEGVLTVAFTQGGPRVANFNVLAVSRGSTRIEVPQSGGFPVNDDVSINVVSSFVRNPSFESTAAPGGIGVGPVLAWESTGTVGLNKAGQPFADNGQFPDRNQVALIQGAGSLQQTISGLKPGTNYWLQFRYNARNCCPEGSTTELTVTFAGQELGKFTATAVLDENPYNSPSINFVPTGAEGVLKFSAAPTGDATLLLDAITIVERSSSEVLVLNPSFEASGSPQGVGYIQPARVSGWDMTGGYGVNVDTVGPFTDNGVAAAQDLVLFMQGNGSSASQLINGLVANQKFTLIYEVNARNGGGPEATTYSATLDDAVLMEEELTPVGVGNPYYARYVVFTAAAESGILKFAHTTSSGDHTLLLDDVRVVPGEVAPPIPQPKLAVSVTTEGKIRLAWPMTFEGYLVQKSDKLDATFVPDDSPVIIEDPDYVVIIEPAAAAQFYRLSN